MEKVICQIIVVTITFITLFSCSRDEQIETKEFPEFIELVSDAEIKSGGYLTPYAVNVDNNVARISFFERNSGATIHLADEKSKLCVELFRDAIQKRVPLKIFTVGNSQEIACVHQVSKDVVGHLQESRGHLTQSRWGLPDVEDIIPANVNWDAYEVFMYEVSGLINWDYSGEGCYARAHRVYECAKWHGFTCYKLFLYPVNKTDKVSAINYRQNCFGIWDWHVVPLIFFDEGYRDPTAYVVDMTISDEPILYNDWIKMIGLPYNYYEIITHGNIYIYNPHYDWTMHDDRFNHTNCVLNYFAGHIGCDPDWHDCN